MPEDEEILEEQNTLPVLPETPEVKEQLEALESEVVGPHIEEMSDVELMENINAINDETLDFLKRKVKDADKETADRAKFQLEVYGATLVLLESVRELIRQKEFNKAEEKVVAFLNEQMEKMEVSGLSHMAIQNAIREIQDFVNIYGQMVEQTEVVEPNAKMQLLSTGIEILPFVGGAKILIEGAVGKNLMGKKLSLKERALHVAEGSMWLTVDTVAAAAGAVSAGSGAVLVEAGELALKAPKAARLLSRGAAVIRATKGTGKGSRAIYNAGRFLVEHPGIAKQTDKIVARGVEARRAALLAAPSQLTQTREANKKSAELIETVNKERKELVTALGQVFDTPKRNEGV